MIKNISKKLYMLVAVLLVCFYVFNISTSRNTAFALSGEETYLATNVLDDLTGSNVNGKAFDLNDYPFDEKKRPQLTHFVEYCYSYKSVLQDNFGLFVYVYNPQGLEIKTDTGRNKIGLRFNASGNYAKYNLQFLNYSNKAGYEGLLYKFRVALTNDQKKSILASLNQQKRIYEVSGIELCVGKTIEEYPVALTYNYTGYALGYGSDTATDNTLVCSVDGFKDTLTLNVKSTYYRPEGHNGKNVYTQDNLHSVYFAVPNKMIIEYGEMTAVHATWLNATLKPGLITGNKSAYDEIVKRLGKSGNGAFGYDNTWGYSYLGADKLSGTHHYFGYGYNVIPGGYYEGFDATAYFVHDKFGEVVNPLYFCFYSGDKTDSADKYSLSSEMIIQTMLESVEKYPVYKQPNHTLDLVCDKYSRAIFESVDEEFTEINIKSTDTFDIASTVITNDNWWNVLFGTYDEVRSETFDGIKAIQAINKEIDLKGTDKEISKRLYVNESDCHDLKTYCNSLENADKTVYLLRYQMSDYISQEASLVSYKGVIKDSNAYFFQQTVNLDFDIIDVTFTKNNVDTVIPVVMTPIDIVHDTTPPLLTTGDNELANLIRLIIAILALVIILIICYPILPYVVKGIAWVISKVIGMFKAIIKSIKDLVSNTKK